MSAETLRAAATRLRETAEAATNVTGAGDWFTEQRTEQWFGVRSSGGLVCEGTTQPESSHIALMSPPVALAVADWLDATAREFDALNNPVLDGHPLDGRRTAGLAVARAVLGGDA